MHILLKWQRKGLKVTLCAWVHFVGIEMNSCQACASLPTVLDLLYVSRTSLRSCWPTSVCQKQMAVGSDSLIDRHQEDVENM